MNIKQLGRLTAEKRAYNPDPFGAYGMGNPQSGFNPYMVPHPGAMSSQGGDMGSGMPSQLGNQTAAPESTPQSRAGDNGTFWNTLGAAGAVTSPWGLPFNAATEAIGYGLNGGAPAFKDVQDTRSQYMVDPSKDSYLNAGKKLFGGVGWSLSNPIGTAR